MISRHGTDADFRAGKVLQNRDGRIELALKLADLADDAPVKGVVAMAEVEPRHVHAGADQPFEEFVGGGDGPDGADDFCPAHFFNLHDSDRESIKGRQSRR